MTSAWGAEAAEMATTEAILRSFADNRLTCTVLSSAGQTRSFAYDSCLPAELPSATVPVEAKIQEEGAGEVAYGDPQRMDSPLRKAGDWCAFPLFLSTDGSQTGQEAVPSSWPPHSQISVDEAWQEMHDSAVGAESCAPSAIKGGVGNMLYATESVLPFYPLWAPPRAFSDQQVMGAQLDKAGDLFAHWPGMGGSQTGSSDLASVTATPFGTRSARQAKLDKDAVHFLQVGSAALVLRAGSLSSHVTCDARGVAGLDVWTCASSIPVERGKGDARRRYRSDHGNVRNASCRTSVRGRPAAAKWL